MPKVKNSLLAFEFQEKKVGMRNAKYASSQAVAAEALAFNPMNALDAVENSGILQNMDVQGAASTVSRNS